MEIRLLAARQRRALPPLSGRHVGLDADDGTDPLLQGVVDELDRAEEVAVVGDRDCLHPEGGGALEQGVDLLRSVEQRVLGVIVKVDERVLAHSLGWAERYPSTRTQGLRREEASEAMPRRFKGRTSERI